MHVLIVDDELLARNRLRVLLSECEDPASPFVIEEAASTAQALEFLQRSPIPVNILFLDVQMPGPNGLVLAQTVRSMSKPPAVVFVTAHAMYAANAFELEATDYLTKPVRLERLQQTLARYAAFVHWKGWVMQRITCQRWSYATAAVPSACRCTRSFISRPNRNTSRCVLPLAPTSTTTH